MSGFMGWFFVISITYAGIAGLAVFVLSLSISDGGARMPPGNEPLSKKEMPA
jgi:hypothetical protein